MNLALTEEQHFVRESFASLFANEAPSARVREAEGEGGHDPGLWNLLTETGALGVGVPEDLGGGGGGLLELSLIAEEAGRRVAPVPFPQTAAAAPASWLNVESVTYCTTCSRGPEYVSLATGSGPVERQLLTDGAVADIVLSLQGDQVVAVHRPAVVRRVSNMGGLPMARWETPAEIEILAKGDRSRRRFAAALDEVRILRAAALNGLASEAIEIGAAYARQREAFGIPIGTYQAVAHPLADALVAKDGAQLPDLESMLGDHRTTAARIVPGRHGVCLLRRVRLHGNPAQPSHPRRLWLHRRMRHPAVLPTGKGMGHDVRRPGPRARRRGGEDSRPRSRIGSHPGVHPGRGRVMDFSEPAH